MKNHTAIAAFVLGLGSMAFLGMLSVERRTTDVKRLHPVIQQPVVPTMPSTTTTVENIFLPTMVIVVGNAPPKKKHTVPGLFQFEDHRSYIAGNHVVKSPTLTQAPVPLSKRPAPFPRQMLAEAL